MWFESKRNSNGTNYTSAGSTQANPRQPLDLQRNMDNTLIDNLSYSYYSNGNRLKSVDDASGNTAGYAPNTGQYLYDANANMTYDPSKKITVSYNHLNLPRVVEFDNSDFIEYTYTATGTKLRKTVTSWKTTSGGITDYAGQFLYQDNELSCICTPVGRIVPMQYNDEIFWKHEYNLKDHLGNTRIVFAAHQHGQPEVMQQTSYYPFGMTLQQQNFGGALNPPNKLLYNGKELQDDELAGVSLDWYDYGARKYDAQLGRWHVVDPLAEKYPNISPYAYCANNPILFKDPDGREIWIYYQDKNGDEQKMQYTTGMEYSGDNKFVASSVQYLNQMGSTEAGGKVLGSLIGSENAFNMTNTFAQDKKGNDIKGALVFAGSESGGGQIHAAELLNSTLAEGAKLESAAHELFHGYQHENGQGGASIFNEVEAMVFSVAVSTQYSFDNMTIGGGASTSLGKDGSQASQTYQSSFQKLLYNESFPKSSFVSAVKNFKQGAAKNTTGMYNNYPLRRSNQTKSMLSKFYPLIK